MAAPSLASFVAHLNQAHLLDEYDGKVKVIERHAFGIDCHWYGNIFAEWKLFFQKFLDFWYFFRMRKDFTW